jgi:dUTP pyrophosphatase
MLKSIISDLTSKLKMPSPIKKPRVDVSPDTLQVAKLTEHAIIPTRGSKLAAGYDLYSAYEYSIPPRGKILAKTDIQIKVPHGTYGRVAPRSGLAWKQHIDIGAGVVDEDYRGNLGVVMFNHSEVEVNIKAGDRIAQLVCEKISYPEIQELETLDDTERGEGGFGSTGTN